MTAVTLQDGSLFDPEYEFAPGIVGPTYDHDEKSDRIWYAGVAWHAPDGKVYLETHSMGSGTLAQELAMWSAIHRKGEEAEDVELLTTESLKRWLAAGAIDRRDTQEHLDRYCSCGGKRDPNDTRLEICWLSEPMERPIR